MGAYASGWTMPPEKKIKPTGWDEAFGRNDRKWFVSSIVIFESLSRMDLSKPRARNEFAIHKMNRMPNVTQIVRMIFQNLPMRL